MTLTKAQIIQKIIDKKKCSIEEARQYIEKLAQIFNHTLIEGKEINIRGFGKFCIKQKRERNGRTLHSEEIYTFPARKVITFYYSNALKRKMNNIDVNNENEE